MNPTTNACQAVDWQAEAGRVAARVRRRVLDHTLNNNGGYLSQACSAAETLAAPLCKDHEPGAERVIGGGLFKAGPDLVENCRYFLGMIS